MFLQPAFAGIFVFAQESSGLPWWAWLLIILLIIFLVWWWLRSSKEGRTEVPTTSESEVEHSTTAAEPVPTEPTAPSAAAVTSPETIAPPEPVAVPEPVAAPEPDDLTIIEGIGPKIDSVLKAAGIISFEQLSQTPPERVKEILLAAGLRLADPQSWGKQAQLAAAKQWEELKQLQSQLKGGRLE